MQIHINFLIPLLIWGTCVICADATPEIKSCEDVPPGEVLKMRDLTDCNKYYYCHKGLAKPFRVSCPFNRAAGIYLYFNPNTTNCDFYWNVPSSCFGPGTGGGFTTTTTTESPTTTTKPPRPPKLNDENGLIIDCSRKVCGLFPNTYGSCDSYVVCINGEKVTKKCNGGQLFDVVTKECQPAQRAKCWAEPNAGPHTRTKKLADCPFHNFVPSAPIETMEDGIVLRNPVVTSDGRWQPWVECPEGKYATGVYAWRRLLQQGISLRDHVGIVSLSFLCQTPGTNEMDSHIVSATPNAPKDEWPFYYMCRGAAVGFRLNSVGPAGWGGDKIGTDNVQAMCSCSGPAFKPYDDAKYAPQNGHRGIWTQPQFCKKHQAVCGMQTQMQDYKEYMLGKYDNSGLHNMKVKCCDVPDPNVDKCEPAEDRQLVRTCDNLKKEEYLRCDFESEVGRSMDLSNQKHVDFYTSIGYAVQDFKDNVTTHIQENLEKKINSGIKLEYTWDDIVEPAVEEDEPVITRHTLYVRPDEKHELFQVVGKCGFFLIRSNRYIRVITNGSGTTRQEIFEI